MAAELIIAPEVDEDVADAYAWYENRRLARPRRRVFELR